MGIIFDCHTDILNDIVSRRKKGERDVFLTRHYSKFKKGEISGACIGYYYESKDFGDSFDLIIAHLEEELRESICLDIILRKQDLDTFVPGKIKTIFSIEGLSKVKSISDIDKLYQSRFRLASLCWNDQNDLATGVGGNPELGLTPLGAQVIKRMQQLGMIVDVSHANSKTLQDIIKITTKPIVASHSNSYHLTPHRRNLKDDQLKSIANTGGVICLTPVSKFVCDQPNATIQKYVEHILYVIRLVGIEHVGLGFDFMDYLADYEEGSSCQDFNNAGDGVKIIRKLKEAGLAYEDIEKIAYKNLFRVFKENLS